MKSHAVWLCGTVRAHVTAQSWVELRGKVVSVLKSNSGIHGVSDAEFSEKSSDKVMRACRHHKEWNLLPY